MTVIALVGRPNVGKSTLFNQLTRTRDALVFDRPGVTRDCQTGLAKVDDKKFWVVDCAGLEQKSDTALEASAVAKTWAIVEQADCIAFIVDAIAGIVPTDLALAKALRKTGLPIKLIVNKSESYLGSQSLSHEFFALGFGDPILVAAKSGRGIKRMVEAFDLNHEDPTLEKTEENLIHIAFIGKPNAGKSTLLNQLLGKEHMLVSDVPGTTRDKVAFTYENKDKRYRLIDTAGVRKKAKIKDLVEKFSIAQSLKAITESQVVALLVDLKEGLNDQDLVLLRLVLEAGRSAVVVLNKSDSCSLEERKEIIEETHRKLRFAAFIPVVCISAKEKKGLSQLFSFLDRAHESANIALQTNQLTRLLEEAVAKNPPPLSKGRRIKLRYANPGGHCPPTVVVHGKQTECLPLHYLRYLEKYFQKALDLIGTPVKLILKTDLNPYF